MPKRKLTKTVAEGVSSARQRRLTPWLGQEWAAGCRNGAELWRRLRSAGVRGSLRVVGERATRQRRDESATPSGAAKSPPARKIARFLTTARDHLCKAAPSWGQRLRPPCRHAPACRSICQYGAPRQRR